VLLLGERANWGGVVSLRTTSEADWGACVEKMIALVMLLITPSWLCLLGICIRGFVLILEVLLLHIRQELMPLSGHFTRRSSSGAFLRDTTVLYSGFSPLAQGFDRSRSELMVLAAGVGVCTRHRGPRAHLD